VDAFLAGGLVAEAAVVVFLRLGDIPALTAAGFQTVSE
jgi:hypothetical protein